MIDTREEVPGKHAEALERSPELEHLGELGATLDGEAIPCAAQAATATSSATEAQAWAALPAMFGGILAMAMPELRDVYKEEACATWGAAMVPVAHKYGWSADALIGPEAGLVLASVPLAVGTFAAVRAYKARAAAEAKAAEGGAKAPDHQEPAGAVQPAEGFAA